MAGEDAWAAATAAWAATIAERVLRDDDSEDFETRPTCERGKDRCLSGAGLVRELGTRGWELGGLLEVW